MASIISYTKYTNVFSCPDDIKNLKIQIRIKKKGIEKELLEDGSDNVFDCKVFRWQEKVFNNFEKVFYKNINNCLTDIEKNYNKIINDTENMEDKSILSSYVDEEDCPFKNQEGKESYNYLRKLVEEVESYDAEEEVVNELFDYKDSVIHCIQNPVLNRKFEFMWIVADFGYYIDETWIKYEKLLCTIKYNKTSNTLSIFPDFTKSQPYSIEIEGETNTTYLYFIENVSSKIPETISLNEKELIRKITNQKTALKSNLTDITFLLPPKNKLHVVLFLEILSANHFEYNDIFVQYFIDLPKFWTCHNEDTLSGLTQICCGKGDDGLVHFSYCCDVLLEYNIQQLEGKNDIPKMPYIYFEVISKDSWKRYRTEGLTYKTLPVHSPGSYFYNLCCFRLSPQSFSGNLRRFFIGDCSNYNDITWIGIPKDHQGNTVNKFGVNTIGTGQLNIRINVIHQSQAFMKEYNDEDVVKNREKFIFEKLNSSSLIKSVEQVLQAFRKARKNMIAARKNI